jgi:hypothetical protein
MTKNFDIFPKSNEDIANLSVFQQYQDQATAGYAVLTGLIGSRTSASKVDYPAGTYNNGGVKKSSDLLPHLYIDSVPAAAAGKLRYDLIYIDGTDNTIKREAGTEATPDDPAKFLENYTPKPPQLADTDWIVLSVICIDENGIVTRNFGSYATAGVANLRKSSGMAVDDITLAVDANGVVSVKSAPGGINYITNYNAAVDTTGWAAYADAVGVLPVDGTGGSPTITWTRTISNSLRGIGSFLLAKDAANRRGQGASYDFIIDRSDASNLLLISFDWESDVTLSAGDLIVYIYDKDNNVLIQPTPYTLQATTASIQNHVYAQFQTAALSAANYRLILHIASTSAVAWNIKFDNFNVGPSSYAIVTKGVTNGDSHDHNGGDGGQIDHGGLAGLGDDDHTQYIKHSLATAANDFLVASGLGTFAKNTLAETKTVLGLGSAAYTSSGDYAVAAKGVTNGDSHDHNGGDGGQIDHGGLAGLGDDDHTQYIKHALVTAANDFLVASGNGAVVKKTLAEAKTILGITGSGITFAEGTFVGTGVKQTFAHTMGGGTVIPHVTITPTDDDGLWDDLFVGLTNVSVIATLSKNYKWRAWI